MLSSVMLFNVIMSSMPCEVRLSRCSTRGAAFTYCSAHGAVRGLVNVRHG